MLLRGALAVDQVAQRHPALAAASLYGLHAVMGGLPRTLLSWGVEEMVGEKMDAAKAYAVHKAATLMEVPKAYVEMATAGIAFGFELFVAGRVKKTLDHAKDVSKSVEKLAVGSVKKGPKAGEKASSALNPKNVAHRQEWQVPQAARDKIPEFLKNTEKPAKGVGIKWEGQKPHKGDYIRIDKGDPKSSYPSGQKDHVHIQSGGKVIGRDGKPIEPKAVDNPASHPNAHIPLEEWLNWRHWNKP